MNINCEYSFFKAKTKMNHLLRGQHWHFEKQRGGGGDNQLYYDAMSKIKTI